MLPPLSLLWVNRANLLDGHAQPPMAVLLQQRTKHQRLMIIRQMRRRRDFIAGLAMWPLEANAQQQPQPVIGHLDSLSAPFEVTWFLDRPAASRAMSLK